MNQPLIFSKQVITLIAISILLIIELVVRLDSSLIILTFFCTILVFSITFTPSIRNFKYSKLIRTVIYYIPFVIPALFVKNRIDCSRNEYGIFLGTFLAIMLILSNYKHNKFLCSDKNPVVHLQINKSDIIYAIFSSIGPPICEEIFYRYFVINSLWQNIGLKSIIVSTILFVYSHYINRWANVQFNLKSYIYHGVIGMSFGLIYVYTGSIIGCIVGHIIFNSPNLVLLYKQIKNSENDIEVSFDDY